MTKNEILTFLQRKKKEFKNLFDIKNIGLFGSYAREENNESSDIDIVYVLEDRNRFGYFEYVELEEILSRQFNKKVELVNFKYMNPIIKEKAKREIIYA